MNKIIKTILLILIALAGVSLPAFASYIPFNTSVNMNVGIGTSTPQGAFVVTNGNVGIGTWAPTATFTVSGDTILGSVILNQLASNGTDSLAGGYGHGAISGGIITSSGNGSLAFGEAAGIANTAVLTSSSDGSIALGYAFRNLTNTGTLQATGTASVAIGENVQATAANAFALGLSVVNPNASSLMIGFNPTPTLTVTGTGVGIGTSSPFGGGLIVLPANTGNVGIGSLTPGQVLDVTGTVRAIGLTMSGQTPVSGYVLTASDSSGDATWSPSSSVGTNYWLNDTTGNVGISTTYAVGIGTSFVGGTGEAALSVMNGNVGIGTWVPAENLDISASGGGALQLENTNLTIPNYSSLGSNITTHTIGIIADNGTTYGGLAILGFNTNPPNSFQDMPVLIQGIFGNTNTNSLPAIAFSGGKTNGGTGVTNLANSDILAQFENNNTGLVTILGSGNVGIGTLSPFGGGLIVLPANTGNVGIGSLTPGQVLDVTGTVRMTGLTLTGNGAANGNVLVGNSVGVGTWMPASTLLAGGGTNYWLNNSGGNVGISTTYAVGIGTSFVGGTGEAALSVMNGNVGIGTWVPANLLDIKGQLNITDISNSGFYTIYYSQGIAGDNSDLTFNAGSNIDHAGYSFTTRNNAGNQINALEVDRNGNVGLGTVTPGGALTVMTGNVGIGTWKPLTALEVDGGAVGAFGLGGPDIAPAVFSSTNLAGNHTNYIVINNNDGAGNLSNGIAFDSVKTELWSIVNDYENNGSQNLAILDIPVSSATPVMLIDALGNVGIGTVTPGQKFDVQGTIRTTGLTLTGNGAANGNVLVGNSIGVGTWMPASTLLAGGGTNYWLNNSGGNVGINTSYAVGIGTTFVGGTGEASFAVMNGNVGIGTWAPSDTLEVSGAAGGSIGILSPEFSASVLTFGYPGQFRGRVQYSNDATDDLALISSGIITFSVNDAGSTAMTLDPNGNLGIGTATPVGGLVVMNGNVGIGTWVPKTLLQLKGSSQNFYINNIGDVGIGSISPQDSLDVVGNIDSSDFVNAEGISIGGNDGVIFGGTTSDAQISSTLVVPYKIQFETGGGAYGMTFWNDNSLGIGTTSPTGALEVEGGNVGIGTWAPGVLLDVKGTARMTGFALTGNGAASGNVMVTNGVGVGTWMPASTLLAGGGTNYWLNNSGGNVGISTTYAVGIGTTFVGGTGEAALSVMNGNVGIGTWVPIVPLQVVGIGTLTANGGGLIVTKGNVGIGTTVPGYPLDVNGGSTILDQWVIHASSNTAAPGGSYITIDNTNAAAHQAGFAIANQGAGKWYIVNSTTSNTTDDFGIYSGALNEYVFGISTTGNVGIGTITPQGGLTVMNGNVGIGTWVPTAKLSIVDSFSGTAKTVLVIGATGGATGTDIGMQFQEAGFPGQDGAGIRAVDDGGSNMSLRFDTDFANTLVPNQMVILGSGNVGIGTVNPFGGKLIIPSGNVGIGSLAPGQLLDVQGTARMTGFALTGNGAAAGNVLVSNTIGVGTWMPTTTLPVGTLTSGTTNQVAYYSGALTLSSNSSMVFNAPNVGLGTVTPLATLQVVGNIGIGTVKNGDKFITTAPPNGGFIAEGNVGVGSWAPGQKLDVQGTVRDIGELVNGNVGIGTTFINGPGEAALSIMNGSVGIGTWVPGTVAPFGFGPFPGASLDVESANSNAGSFAVLVNNSNGDGIAAFDSLGDAAGLANGNGSGFAVSGFDSAGDVGGIAVSESGIDAALYGQGVTYGLYVQGSTNYLQGNVGIGTLTPTNQLVVNGAVGIGTANSSYVTTLAPAGGMIVQGNVGIGSLHPGQVLDIQGTVRDLGVLVNGNVGIGTSFVNGAGEGAVSVMNGNVGIGTWVPAGQLDIEGTLSVAIFHGNVGIGTATVPAYNLDLVNNTARERNVRRVNTSAGSSSPISINSDTTDLFTITALAQNSVINITTGTPNNGDLLEVRILDNGTARTLTWGSSGATIASTTTTLPATTVISTTLRVLLEYNSAATRWECIGVT